MATTTNLNFTEADNGFKATFTSAGLCTVQMKCETLGNINVSANINGMDAATVSNFMDFDNDVIFNVDVPSGLQVTITSTSKVVAAKMYMA